MAITNKFIHFNTKAKFVERYATETDDFKNKYTIFIKDTKQIWAHGGMYGGYYKFATAVGGFTVTVPNTTSTSSGETTTTVKVGKVDSAAKADKVINALTITNGSNSVVYDGSVAKSITISNYELTAAKIATAWGSNKISTNGVLSLGTKDVYTLIGTTADNVNGIATTGTIQVGTKVNLAANNAETMISSTGVFTQGSMKSKDGFFQTSDARKKNFLSDIEINFDALKKLPKKYFEWKDNSDEGQQIGTSAQAMLRLYPELVNEDENGYYSVDYARLSIIALAAIDKLNDRIESLKRIINSK